MLTKTKQDHLQKKRGEILRPCRAELTELPSIYFALLNRMLITMRQSVKI
jgi:hypothetical protein